LSPARGALCLPVLTNPIAVCRRQSYKSDVAIAEWTATADVQDERSAPVSSPDPLGFLAGRRYTCYCGRSVVGTILCPACADEMVRHFLRVARQLDEEL